MKGFLNLGNTCYLNSGLQLLMNIPEFCQLILNNKNISNELSILAEFIILYHSDNNGSLKPKFIKKIVSKRNNIFSGFSQEDSQEFLIYFLDFIDNQIKENKINDLLGMKIDKIIKCKALYCLKKSITKETRLFLILDIQDNFNDLNDCYRNYKIREKLKEDNRYFCENCDKKRIAIKRIEVAKWPKNLIIVLKRFQQDGYQLSKNDTFLDIPNNWRHNYKLKGGVIHSGRLGGGHYVYFGNYDNKWFLFDDSHISRIKSNQLNDYKKRAYLLHYRID
jgi:ubiquitin C-terminal hydrolase